MSSIRGVRPTIRFPWRTKRQLTEDVEDELAFHLAQRTDELVERGWKIDDAREEARKQFGDLEFTKTYCRDEDLRRERESRTSTMIQELRQDFFYALRSLRSAPGFTLVALLTLALGIGANTAIFSVVRGVLLRPLPFPAAEEIVRVWHANKVANDPRSKIAEPDFVEWRASNASFATLGAYWYSPGGSGANLTGSGSPERIEGAYVTDGFFQTLRSPVFLGRAMSPEEHMQGRNFVIVLSHGLWVRRFGSDPGVIGRPLTIDAAPYTVIGVMPPNFTYPAERLDFWIPLSTIPEDGIGRSRQSRFLEVIGRLKAGTSIERAHDDLAGLSRRIAAEFPDAKDYDDVTVMPIRESIVGDVSRPLMVLLGAVGFVLLITCVNIAGLLLARATARQREIAVRSALGAGRGRLIRQLLTESLVLALTGGLLGVALAYVGVRTLTTIGAAELPRASAIRIDGAVLLYALGVSMLAGILFGLLPALRATSANLQGMLRAGSRGSVGAAGGRLRGGLVVAEVALAVILVIGAGLAAKSFARLLDVDPGFQPANLLALKLSTADERTDGDKFPGYYHALLDAVARVPGVQIVGAAKNFPLRGSGEFRAPVIIPGSSGGTGDRSVRLPVMHVSADYFRAMGIPLRAGRTFTPADRDSSPPVWIVNDAFVQKYWPGENAVGKTVKLGQTPIHIIGVIGDVRQISLTEPAEPTAYIHYLQNRRSGLSMAIRVTGDPINYVKPVREAIWSVHKDQTITSIETMSDIVGGTIARPRLLASLLVLFGLMGLSLGALGIYGVLAYSVSQRRQEIGVRVALGATPRSVLGFIVRQGMTLAIVGVVLGVIGALMLTRAMATVLYEVRATDLTTFAAVVVVLLATALIASWLPARRALRIDPVQALRYD